MPSATTLWRHGLTEEDYEAILDTQLGACALCGSVGRLVIDHDHECCPAVSGPKDGGRGCGNCVRGIVCFRCNSLLGFVEKSGFVLVARAIGYLHGDNARGYVSGMASGGTAILQADAATKGMRWIDYCAEYGLSRPEYVRWGSAVEGEAA